MNTTSIVGIVLVLLGGCLLGFGMTGYVISQSCCFPPDCPTEYLCDAAEPVVENPVLLNPRIFIGGFLISLGVIFLFIDTRKKKSS